MKLNTGCFLALAAACCSVTVSAQEEKQAYIENEWNYVDGSMDVSHGIPDDALGRLALIQETGKLRVATEPYFAPAEFIDPGKTGQDSYVGADMELARLIAQRMEVELEIVPMEFSEVLPAVAEGECDLAVSALSFTPARAGMVELSKGYYYSEEVPGSGILIRAEDKDRITALEDLEGLDIVAQAGSLQETMMAENVTSYRQFRRLPSILNVYEYVREGKADAGAVDPETALAYIRQHPQCGLTLVEGILFELDDQFKGDRIAGRKGDLELMYFVNGVIDEVLDSGKYTEWYDQYEAYAEELAVPDQD